MISFIIGAIKIIALLGFLVFIHELGHFTVAKLCKVKVNEFAIGFGPTIWKKKGKETKYALRLIPLGGFVSMEGETERSDEERSFSKVSIPKRIAIVAAGGLVNIIFAICVFLPLQMSVGQNITTKIDNVVSGYAAETSGIQSGDTIKKINGKKVRIKSDIDKIMENCNGEELMILLERNGNIIETRLNPTPEEYYTTGMYLEAEDSTKVQGFVRGEDSVENQGVNVGDTIISIAGENVENNASKLSETIQQHYNDEKINFVVRRLGGEVSLDIIPIKKVRYKLGVNFTLADESFGTKLYYGLINTGDFAFSIVENLKQLFTGKVKTSDFMGPVGISRAVAKTDGWASFISMLTLISLSLGVTNLLPFPPLDGGKIVLLIIEAIRKKPLDEKYEVGIQMVGFGLMIMLSLYVTYHDILRIV
ncbi:MAG: site-2 protease family protein [Clostridia bacterium]|nr:site-2 protease family protein [Clostridia bacterium]